jgi:hypothetical protein
MYNWGLGDFIAFSTIASFNSSLLKAMAASFYR